MNTNALFRMCRINDNGLLGRLISDKVSIIIARPRPYNIVRIDFLAALELSGFGGWSLLTHRNSLNMHLADLSSLAGQSLGKLV